VTHEAAPRYDRFQPADIAEHERLKRQIFGRDAALARYLRQSVGEANIRVMRDGTELAGMLAMLPMAQYFGGHAIPSVGIGNVGVAPAWRGRGVFKALMLAMFEEMRDAGYPLSTLYPSSVAAYRRVGYEPAGIRIKYAIEPMRLAGLPETVSLSVLPVGEDAILKRLHAAEAGQGNGAIERSPTLWQRKLAPHLAIVDRYLIHGEAGGEPTGYLLVSNVDIRTLDILDWCALDGAAARQILSFIAGARAVLRKVTWDGGPEDRMLHLMPEQGITIDYWRHWMLRILDAPAALVARGYPMGVTASLTLDLSDPLLAWNNGRFRLDVSEGRGQIEKAPASGPALRLDIGALSPLFTGHLSPSTLASMGAIEGDAAMLQRAALIFAGPKPWMTDVF
jgi:predicted acetyltransferase